MPQPSANEAQARLRKLYGSKVGATRAGGGKNVIRRKKFKAKKSTNEFEKRLQANLKKLSCNTIPGIEEVNLFKSDGTVIHFVSPKVDAEVSSNTFIVSGNYTTNKIEELLPDILPQIGSDHLTQLKDYAEKFEALRPNNDDGDEAPALVGGGDSEDVPMLIDDDLNFEAVAQSDEKKPDDKDPESENTEKAAENETDDAANAAEPKKDEAKAESEAVEEPDSASKGDAEETAADAVDAANAPAPDATDAPAPDAET